MRISKWFAVLAALLLVAGCGGGGGGGGGGALDGTWGGTIESTVGALGVITVTISGSTISGSTPDGPFSGTITQEQGAIWGFTFTDGTEGGFMHDSSATHAVFVDDSFNFGVVQKGASGPSSYLITDIAGTWSGGFATVDASFFLATTGTASGTVALDTTFSGDASNGDMFSGDFPLFNPSFGVWGDSGLNISSSLNGSGNIRAFLTNDKNFAGSYACFSGFPDGCAFNFWTRQ